jgi:hypothetical protein
MRDVRVPRLSHFGFGRSLLRAALLNSSRFAVKKGTRIGAKLHSRQHLFRLDLVPWPDPIMAYDDRRCCSRCGRGF